MQQYSVDVQRELPGNQSISVSYVGARGDHLGLGGTSDTGVNVNQLDPKYLALGAGLNTQLPNPFFGNPNAGPFANSATLSRAMQDFGLELTSTVQRLNAFNAVQNTYLGTFQVLGGLGLLLGSAGLGAAIPDGPVSL